MDSFESDADLCVLGGGIAGMLVAERALSLGRRVLLVERGTPLTAQQRLRQRSHDDPLPFNRSPHRLPHERPPVGPRIRWDRDYPYWPVYNLGGCTNHFFGNMPRFHPAHFDAPAFAGGIARKWPLTYADLEAYYLEAERRLEVAGSAARTPFKGRFDYPLPPHRLCPSDRACQTLFGEDSVIEVPNVRPSRAVGGRPACCGSNQCNLCPIDSKGTALNTVLPAIRDRVTLETGWLATTIHCAGGRVDAVTAVDAKGRTRRIHARQFVLACNGVDSCLLLQRSPDVPALPSLGRYFMDHPIIQIAIYGSGVDARPGYGDSAQTGMFVPFFERTSDALPVSMLAEVRSGSLSQPSGELMRNLLTRDLLAEAVSGRGRGHASAPLHRRLALDAGSLVSRRAAAHGEPDRGHRPNRADRAVRAADCAAISHRTSPPASTTPSHSSASKLRQGTAKHVGSIPTSFHWLGSTRMADSARDGCVDPDLRYHDLENLFVLSTSVFPSASSANPTLTLAALALRLGDHLGKTSP